MQDASLSAELRALITQRPVHEPFLPGAVDDIVAVVSHSRLAKDEVLVREGDFGDSMYVVVRGRLGARVALPEAGSILVDEMLPGQVVGEIALLTGQPHDATVFAVEDCDLARLARTDFERLVAAHPQALQEFLHRVLPRMRRQQLVRILTEVFGELESEALGEIESALEWVRLDSGTMLFSQGDAGDDLYIVVNGRLRVVASDPGGAERVLEEVGRGGSVGEVALLTGERRTASVYAVRDSDLLKLSKETFGLLLDRHPRAMMQIARAAADRLRRETHRPARRGSVAKTFALVPAGRDVPLGELGRRLVEALRGTGEAVCLAASDVDRLLAKPAIAQSGESTVVHESLVAWLSQQEREHAFLVLQADPGWTPWTRRCLRQADRVLIVGRAGDSTAPGEVEAGLTGMGLKARSELVVIHPDATTRPHDTRAWLEPRRVAAHHHLRLGLPADVQRLARRITGRATGLVLGGGGARGFAHIGALRALGEAGVTVDAIGGASIGALIAAGYATGLTSEAMTELAKSFASRRKLLDRTLPVTALMAGRKVTSIYRAMFDELRIEDLWLPLFVVSSGLTRATAVVHRTDLLWRAIRASTAIPAIFPPLLKADGEVLVDGGVMNNMPLDVMRELCEGGTVIGVNPMPAHDRVKPYRFGPSLSGWEALLGRLKLFGVRTRAPSILGAVMRATEINSANRMRSPQFRALADLLIEPPVDGFPILAFDRYPEIIDIGYRSAHEHIEGWRARTTAAAAA